MRDPTPTEFVVGAGDAGARLDVYLARRMPSITRSHAQRLIDDGRVRVDGRAPKPGRRVSGGERVSVAVPPRLTAEPLHGERIALDVIFEDEDLLVVNKPAAMTVHPAPGHSSATLVNALLGRTGPLSNAGGRERPGIVHRLDRDTSGLIVVAKTDAAHAALTRQLKGRAVDKVYVALVEGTPAPPEGVIDAPLARDPRHRQRMAVVEGGREAVTAYRVIERFRGASLVEVRPQTGRTHQIRVHLAAVGHAVLGDRVYGHASSRAPRQLLHAAKIAFAHPRTGARVAFEAPLPEDFVRVVDRLRPGGPA